MSTLANQLVAAEKHDIARAIRQLLATPLITERADPAAFDTIRRRQEPLTKWFDYTCGWSLVVESRRGYARLLKVRATPDASRPARRLRAGRAPFDRRRYILLCIAAAELLTVPVTTIGLLAGRVIQAMAADPVLPPFDSTHRTERMALVDALRLLEAYGALQALDGNTEAFVDSEHAKVLYRVDATLLMRLPAAPIGPSRLAAQPEQITGHFDDLLHELTRERRYGTAAPSSSPGSDQVAVSDTQRNLWLRHSILRRLFDDPVLYRDDLTDDEQNYLASPTGRQILRRATEQAGFALEERAEGFLLVDPDAIATDATFPDDASTARIAALLLLEHITGPTGGATREQLTAAASDLLRRFPKWAKAYQSTEGARRLADEACAVLSDFHLIHHHSGRTLARPAAWRYRVTATKTPSPPPPRTTSPTVDTTFEEEALW